jgi:hypothetical protein
MPKKGYHYFIIERSFNIFFINWKDRNANRWDPHIEQRLLTKNLREETIRKFWNAKMRHV